jgi:C1A family cysteine protease
MLRKSLQLALIAVVLGTAGTAALAQTSSDIERDIKAKGKKWVAGDTSISRLPDTEKKKRLGLLKHAPTGTEPVLSAGGATGGSTSAALPAYVDWRSWVTGVRNQQSCGSCWAFATTAALESHLLIQGGTPGIENDRAEQILLSCSTAGSCSGGYIGSASDFIKTSGLPPEADYPYTVTNGSCSTAKTDWPSRTATIGAWSYVNTAPANLNAIKNALATYGPLVTTMDVYYDFYSYKGGVYEYVSGSYQGGHAILIVGYEDDSTVSGGGYFVVKNSWGTSWGNQGYFYIAYSQLAAPVYFGEWTIAYSTPVLPPVPSAPSTLSAMPASSTRINLAWADTSTNESGFRIYRCAGAGCSSFSQIATAAAGATSYADSTVTGATSYSYKVAAYNTGGNSGYSNVATAVTPAACTCAVSPANVSLGLAATSGQSTVTTSGCGWTPVSNASWITVTNVTSTGFRYTVSASKSRRTGTVTVNNAKLTITQSKK